MRLTLSWLRDHLETDAGLDGISGRLTAIGLEVEGVSDRSEELAPFLVGHVVSAEPHPNADRLRVCEVDIGSGRVPVVCGAPNARAGMKGVFAPIGARIPGTGTTLAEREIRGVAGKGMLCSDRELGTGDDHDGIVELAADAPTGEPWAAWAGLDDPAIEIGLTPNRGDCASVRGIARDLAAAGVGTLAPRPEAPGRGGHESPVLWRRDLPGDLGRACPFVAGRHFRGVSNGASPGWMRRRLEAAGLRPITALVDITNYVTLDLGRPLHVFDADRLQGDPVMRMAREGEALAALDGGEYALDPEMTVIADGSGPIAIGGIMGGEATGCTGGTTSVFLEAALFDPVRTAATGRRLGILSDARYRFERGVDPASAEWGVDEATRLILDICGGEASEPVGAGEMPPAPAAVAFRPARVAALGGVEVPEDEQEAILGRLGFETARKGRAWSVAPPSWRPDIDGEADLVEEVLRIHGFDAIPETPVARAGALPGEVAGPRAVRLARARRALALRGLEEAVTFSFIPAADAEAFGGGGEGLRLDNPISPELDTMRPSLLPSLLAALAANAARGERDAGLFEVGAAYRDPSPEGEGLHASAVRAGARARRHWDVPARDVDAFDAKADAEAAAAAAGFPPERLQVRGGAPAWYHPGRSGVLALGKAALAAFGEIHPAVLRRLGVPGPAAGCEVFLDAFPEPRGRRAAPSLPDQSALMPLTRDFAFVVDGDVASEAVVRAAAGADRRRIRDARVFDVWEGKGLPEGKKSVAVEVTVQPGDAALGEAEISGIARAVAEAVGKATGGRLRGEDG